MSCAACGKMLLILSYSTPEETKEAASAGNPEAQKSQLPELDGEELCFKWELHDARGRDVGGDHLRRGDVWRELAYWEDHERFHVVKGILKDRYGTRFRELRPTRPARFYLAGKLDNTGQAQL